MPEFPIRMCVVLDNPTPRQKMQITRLLRASKFSVVAMDEHNAASQNLVRKAEKLVLFRPYTGKCPNESAYVQRLKNMGWTRDRVIVESVDFAIGSLPGDPVTKHQKQVRSNEDQQYALRSDEEWEELVMSGDPIPDRVARAFGRDE